MEWRKGALAISTDPDRIDRKATGVDFSAELLAAARERSSREGLDIELVASDMRELAWRGKFDAVLCAGSSFGYFDDSGNRAFLDAAARALEPGGRLLLDSGWIAEVLFAHFRAQIDMEAGGIRFLAENRHDPLNGRVESRFTASREGRSETRAGSHRAYTGREVVGMMEEAGLRGFAAYGSLDGRPFVPGSRRLLLTAKRRL